MAKINKRNGASLKPSGRKAVTALRTSSRCLYEGKFFLFFFIHACSVFVHLNQGLVCRSPQCRASRSHSGEPQRASDSAPNRHESLRFWVAVCLVELRKTRAKGQSWSSAGMPFGPAHTSQSPTQRFGLKSSWALRACSLCRKTFTIPLVTF